MAFKLNAINALNYHKQSFFDVKVVLYAVLCTNTYILSTVKYGTELKLRRDTKTLKDHKKIHISDKLYEAIKEKAQETQQTIDQYVEQLLENALTKGDHSGDATRNH